VLEVNDTQNGVGWQNLVCAVTLRASRTSHSSGTLLPFAWQSPRQLAGILHTNRATYETNPSWPQIEISSLAPLE
jgi:hypothetical protein